MPAYDYRCDACGETFTLSHHAENGQEPCGCGDGFLRRVWTQVTIAWPMSRRGH